MAPESTHDEAAGRHPEASPSAAGHDRRVIRGVGAIIVDSSGRLLLIQRGHEPSKGLWSVPGGKVEPGETDAEAVVREVAEETGLAVRCGDLAGSITREGPDGSVYEIYDYDATVVGAAGRGADAGGQSDATDSGAGPGVAAVGVAGSDAADLRWVHPVEMTQLPVTEGLVELLRDWGRLPGSSS